MSGSNWKRWLVSGSSLSEAAPPRADFHMHTTWSDGRASLEEMVASARHQGLEAIAVTEHANFSTQWYADFVSDVCRVRDAHPDIEVYCGMEVAAQDMDGSLKATAELVNQAEILMGVVHSYPKGDGGFWSFRDLSPEHALDLEIGALLGLARNERIDIIGHPGGTYFGKFGPFPVERLAPVFRAAREHGIAVDFNARHCWDAQGMLDLLRETDPMVALGSDAHDAASVGSPQRLLRSLAHAAREVEVVL